MGGFLTGVINAITSRSTPGALEQRAAVTTSHPSADIDWDTFLGIQSRTAGITPPTIEGSLSLPAVFACVRVLSETIASLPLITYRERADGGRERAVDHSLYRLLRRTPNPEQTHFEFEELMTSHVATWGNAFAEMDLANNGQILALWPLRPDRMRVRRRHGELEYIYTNPDGSTDTIPYWRIHHRRGLGSDGIVGYSPIGTIMLSVALGMATEEFGARFFSQGARPGFVLSHPGVLEDDAWARLDKRWNAGGLANAHKVKIIEEGMKVEKIGIPPEEAQFLETQEWSAHQVARVYRMPPHKIGLLKNATFSNIEHQAIEFYTDTIRPWLVRNEETLDRDLLSAAQRQTGLYFEYLADGVLRGDTASRFQAFAIARQWGWMSVNDIRRMENMEPVKGGDVYLQPLNMVQAGVTQRSDALAWTRPIVEDVAKRMAKREANDLREHGQRLLRRQPDSWDAWTAEFYDELTSAASQMIAPTTEAVAHVVGGGAARIRSRISGALWDMNKRSMDRVRLVVREAAGQGVTAADALDAYAGTIEAAGAQEIAGALTATLDDLLKV